MQGGPGRRLGGVRRKPGPRSGWARGGRGPNAACGSTLPWLGEMRQGGCTCFWISRTYGLLVEAFVQPSVNAVHHVALHLQGGGELPFLLRQITGEQHELLHL